MILKTRKRDVHSTIGQDRWVYIDRISQVVTHGYATAADTSIDGHDGRRISVTMDELLGWVEGSWGKAEFRQFESELWPEYDGPEEQRTVTCLHLTRDGGGMVLALVDDATFLLSDDGKTVDRLY